MVKGILSKNKKDSYISSMNLGMRNFSRKEHIFSAIHICFLRHALTVKLIFQNDIDLNKMSSEAQVPKVYDKIRDSRREELIRMVEIYKI